MRPSFWWENPKERDLVRGVSVVGRIILKWILSYNERMWRGFILLNIRCQ
jgi:hypothetical protein